MAIEKQETYFWRANIETLHILNTFAQKLRSDSDYLPKWAN